MIGTTGTGRKMQVQWDEQVSDELTILWSYFRSKLSDAEKSQNVPKRKVLKGSNIVYQQHKKNITEIPFNNTQRL